MEAGGTKSIMETSDWLAGAEDACSGSAQPAQDSTAHRADLSLPAHQRGKRRRERSKGE